MLNFLDLFKANTNVGSTPTVQGTTTLAEGSAQSQNTFSQILGGVETLIPAIRNATQGQVASGNPRATGATTTTTATASKSQWIKIGAIIVGVLVIGFVGFKLLKK